MARPPLPIGAWGSISTKVIETDKRQKPIKHQSQAKFRDHDGHLRNVTAVGRSKAAAEQALLKKLQDRSKTGRPALGELRGNTANQGQEPALPSPEDANGSRAPGN